MPNYNTVPTPPSQSAERTPTLLDQLVDRLTMFLEEFDSLNRRAETSLDNVFGTMPQTANKMSEPANSACFTGKMQIIDDRLKYAMTLLASNVRRLEELA